MLATTESSEPLNSLFRDWKDIGFVWILLTLAGAWVSITAIRMFAGWLTNRLPDRYRFSILPWVPVLRLLIIVTTVIEVVPYIIRPTPSNLLGLFGAAGVAIGFAFKDYVSSLIAGIVALYERPYRVGDWVTIGNDYGEVRSLGMRAVELVTPGDTVVTIPHSRMWDSAIHNANAGLRDMQCVARFYVDPSHDGEAVRQKLLDVALTSVYLHVSRPIVVVAAQLPWGTRYMIRAYPFECREQFTFITDLTLRGNESLQKMGVKMVAAPPVAESEV
jgi:small conductance mechanosensitive channel